MNRSRCSAPGYAVAGAEGRFCRFLVDVAGQLDTSAAGRTSPGRAGGRRPQTLATLAMYAMSCGVRSSADRGPHRTDAASGSASGNEFPDHSTLCRFRRRAGGEDGRCRICSRRAVRVRGRGAGPARGSRWMAPRSADAAKEAIRTGEATELSRKALEEAAAADGDAAARATATARRWREAGCGRCDGTPPGLGLCGRRRGRADGAGRPERADRGGPGGPAGRARRRRRHAGSRRSRPGKARAGQALPGRTPEEAAVAVAAIALEQAAAAKQAKCDADDQRVAASAGVACAALSCLREQAAPARRCGNGWPRRGRPQGPGPPRPRKRKLAGPAGRGLGKGKASGARNRPGRGATSPTRIARDALHLQRHRAGLQPPAPRVR